MAQIQGKSHKCLISLNGTAVIERVIQAVVDTPLVTRIFISIDDPAVLRPAVLRDVALGGRAESG